MEGAGVQVDRSPSRCPYCRDALDPSKELVACVGCGARHHATCHGEHGRCAACGATEVLERRRARHRTEPLAGSKVRVEREGDATHYTWDTWGHEDAVLLVLFAVLVVTLPLVVLYLVSRLSRPTSRLTLRPDEVEFLASRAVGARPRRVPRAEVGVVKVETLQGYHRLTIDVGIERLPLWTGPMTPSLTPPELEWLAQQLVAWRDQE